MEGPNSAEYDAISDHGPSLLQQLLDEDRRSDWERVPHMKLPRKAHGVCAVGSKLYVCGGWDSHDVHNSVEVLDTACLHRPAYSTGHGHTRDKPVALGAAYNEPWEVDPEDTYVFAGAVAAACRPEKVTTLLSAWTKVTEMKYRRYGLGVCSVGSKIYAVGGTVCGLRSLGGCGLWSVTPVLFSLLLACPFFAQVHVCDVLQALRVRVCV